MMIRLHAAGLTDVGQVREGNEDAMHVGDSVFAVADGMGGHAAGEIASALALQPIGELDGRVYGDDEQARKALEDAVVAANRTVVAAAEDDDTLHGMGTTLTAALFEGRRLHLAHVGDSRAYLLRQGDVTQLTRDHTFVQQLLDDGSITQEEAATHPQRSVVTRAIGAATDVEIDLETLDLASGDAMLLCSDGLSGVVDDAHIARLLTSDRPPEQVVTALVAAANEAGGPDNITCVLLTLLADDEDQGVAAPATTPSTGQDTTKIPIAGRTSGTGVGEDGSNEGPAADDPMGDEASDEPVQPRGAGGALLIRPDSNAGPARVLPGPGPDESVVVDPVVRRRRIASITIGIAVVLGLVLGGGRWLLSRSYYVGLDDEAVAIYQGVPASIGPVSLSWVTEETSLLVDDVPQFQQPQLDEGIPAANRGDARNIVDELRESGQAEDASEPDPTPSPTPDLTAEPDETPAPPDPEASP